MARYISLRTQPVAGGVAGRPTIWESTSLADNPTYQPLTEEWVEQAVAGRDVIFAVHGFNVRQDSGARSLARLEQDLQLDANSVFFGILWPGDWWLPVVNYPSEAGDAVMCGVKLADLVNRRFTLAASLSFISHSLGGRLVLETVKRLNRRAREVCVTAAAVDYDCLGADYIQAAQNAERTSVLASAKDKVLKLAYPFGDFASDVLYDSDSPWRRALGLKGPKMPAAMSIHAQQIPDADGYGHGDYFPPGSVAAGPAGGKWSRSSQFMRRALRGEPRSWP